MLPEIFDNLNRILIVGASGSGKTNPLLNLLNHDLDIDKAFSCAKDSYKAKCELLIKKREDIGTKHFNDSKAFTEYSNNMDNIYKNIQEHNQIKNVKY